MQRSGAIKTNTKKTKKYQQLKHVAWQYISATFLIQKFRVILSKWQVPPGSLH